MFVSIYEDTEKEPWEWVRDFLSDEEVALRVMIILY